MPRPGKVLFFPLNSPGHINSCLGIADQLKQEYGCETVFLVLGDVMGTSIKDHGHELIILEEANVYEDYEIDWNDPEQVLDDETAKKLGKTKRKFPGVMKWPRIIMRHQHFLRLDPLESFLQSMQSFEGFMIRELIENSDRYEAAVKSINPDMIVVDAYFIPPCVVKLTHIPWVRLFSANPISLIKSKLPGGLKPAPMCGFELMNKEKRSRLMKESPEKWAAILSSWEQAVGRIIPTMIPVLTPLVEFLLQQGVQPPPLGHPTHDSPYINLYMYPKELDYDQDDDIFRYEPRWLRCDSLMRKETSNSNSKAHKYWQDKLDEAMKGRSEIIYFSLGSLASGNANSMKRFVDILRHDKKRLYVFSKGVNGDSYELDSGNMIGDNYLPQTFFLERANLAIIHGGNNSITECMYYGVPVIVLPCFADQLDNAQRVVDLELGKRLDLYNCTQEQLIGAVDEILSNQELIKKVKNIGQSMRARDESGKISYILKKLMDEGKLDQEFIEECRHKDLDEIKSLKSV